ncbi:MAG: PIN domain nuclease [Gemmatimonadetes bacterium]|nr:PIN domain nuclease [Gemmatimonadota bacterium]
MIVDTSAWVEYTRRTESSYDLCMDAAIRAHEPIATPAVVVMELLSGSRSDRNASALLQLLNRFEVLEPESLGLYMEAASIYRICRRAGFTIRSTVDCLVAATALDKDRPLLARNRDFSVIARYTGLELVIPSDTGPPKEPPRGWSGE